jgi:outer membrane protein assembly factor BamB
VGRSFYRGYDPLTGKELWRLADGVDVKIPTPVAAQGLYFLGGGSSHEHVELFCRARWRKRRNSPHPPNVGVVWQSTAIKPHVVTPLVYGDYLYICTDSGVLTTYNAKTGEAGYRARLGRGGSFNASPVAGGRQALFRQ